MKTPPGQDTIEISLFGPGYGECIVIHLGYNNWIVVDSCINPKNKKPAVLDYFQQINLSTDSIKLIVATHWHDDHVRGLSQVLDECPNSKFVLSNALKLDEFKSLVSSYINDPMIKSSSGIQELGGVFTSLIKTKKTPIIAHANTSIFKKEDKESNLSIEIIALSPSDASVLLSKLEIGKLIPNINTEKRRLPTITPNHSAVVIWIKVNEKIILLGSDLENSKNKKVGWIAILDSDLRPKQKAEVFKIPHHGSPTSYNADIWEHLLAKSPIAILTPYHKANKKLPKEDEIKKYCEHTERCYITTNPKVKKAKIEHKIDKIMGETARNRRLVNPNFGHIRIRSKISCADANWSVELIDGAVELGKLLTER